MQGLKRSLGYAQPCVTLGSYSLQGALQGAYLIAYTCLTAPYGHAATCKVTCKGVTSVTVPAYRAVMHRGRLRRVVRVPARALMLHNALTLPLTVGTDVGRAATGHAG